METKDSLFSISPDDKKAFRRDGFFQLKAFLNEGNVKHYLREIDDILGLAENSHALTSVSKETHTMADGVTKNSQLWPLIFHPKLLEKIRGLVGRNIRYTQHSDIHVNLPAGRWHRDNAHRDFSHGPDWQEDTEPYGVVRVAIYLSDFSSSGSSLLILPGSHKTETFLNRREYVFWNQFRSLARKQKMNETLPHIFLSRPYLRLKTLPGDCLIFDQRVMHAGGRLRGLLPKYAIYMSYGLDNSHSINHRDFFLSRPTYSKNIPPPLEEKLSKEGLLLSKHDS